MQTGRGNDPSSFDAFSREGVDFLADRYNRANRWVVADMIRRSAYHYPEKTALIFQGSCVSYTALEKACNRTANALIGLGVKKFDRVAVLAHNTLHHILAWIGCCKAGAVYVPLNYMLTGSEIQNCINHCRSKVLVVEDSLYDLVRGHYRAMPSVRALIWSGQGMGQLPPDDRFTEFDAWHRQYSDTEPDTVLRIEEPCQMVYTSGTEVGPKAVVMSNQALIAGYMSCIIDGKYDSSDVSINALPVYHSMQRDAFLNPVFYIGGTNVLMGPDINEILKAIEAYKATTLFATPTLWIDILRHPDFGGYDLSSLTKICCGASAMPTELLEALKKRFPGAGVYSFYGQAELASFHSVLKESGAAEEPLTVGRCGLNMEMRLEPDIEASVPHPGGAGEICGRGPHVMMGYYNDPGKTDDAMRSGWFHTGDHGVLDERGRVLVIDRKRDVVRTGHEGIASREIEDIVYRDERVMELAVVGVPHPEETGDVPIAVVIPARGANIREEEIVELCRQHLSSHKVPRKVIFVNDLPKTSSGKLLKREVRKQYRNVFSSVS